jgi:hypothetical protein
MEAEMGKLKSRASNILSGIYEFGGLSHQEVVAKVVSFLVKAQSHRDLRIPAGIIHKYCKRKKCNVPTLETMLNQIGYTLVYKHGWSMEEAQGVLDDLVEKIVAIGRLEYGRM